MPALRLTSLEEFGKERKTKKLHAATSPNLTPNKGYLSP